MTFAWAERGPLGLCWAQNEQSYAKNIPIPPGIMLAVPNRNAGFDAGLIQLGTVAIRCRARILSEILTPND